MNRRRALKLGAAAVAAGVSGAASDLLNPRTADAQAPKRGGVFRLPLAQPPMFDHQLTVNWSTQIAVSFTHSRLVKIKAGPSVTPGTFPLEPDVAESWSQPTETTYVFKLRRGVRWHPKPPVNGRELTAEDVKYTYERFLTVPGNPNRAQLEEVDRDRRARPLHGQVQLEGARTRGSSTRWRRHQCVSSPRRSSSNTAI